jgi:alpha-tubulin suppressor-like RCC1 family protein
VNSSRIQKIACGVGFNLGLTSDKKLLVWGQNYPGNMKPEELMTPKLLEVDFDAVDVSTGNTHCAVVDTKGKVYTWGNNGGVMNGGGQLGLGSYDQVSSPT